MGAKVDKTLILNSLKSHLGFTKDVNFAAFLGIPPSTLSSWKERNTFDYELVYAKCVGVDANWLLTGQGSMLKGADSGTNSVKAGKSVKGSLPLIPIDAMAGVGKGDFSVIESDVERYFIPDFNKKADFLIRISGTSMSPKYFHGDVVACKSIPTETFIQWGKVYVLDTVQGALCKRLMPGSKKGSVKCISDNQEAYPPFELDFRHDIRSLAIVVGMIRME